MFDLTVKRNGKKYTVATWTGGAQMCIALAEEVFRKHGLFSSACGFTEWHDTVSKQKCYAGRLPNCLDLIDTPEQAEYYHRARIIADYLRMGKTQEYIIDLYPEWENDVRTLASFTNPQHPEYDLNTSWF